jgi:hypothetical protein
MLSEVYNFVLLSDCLSFKPASPRVGSEKADSLVSPESRICEVRQKEIKLSRDIWGARKSKVKMV